MKLLYEGKAKKVYVPDNNENQLLHEFKDSATAFDGLKKGTIGDKGSINARLSSLLFPLLEKNGIKTHFIKFEEPNKLYTLKLDMIPIEVVVRNIVAGSLAKRTGFPEGKEVSSPIVEIYYKNDDLNDPLINDDHAVELGLASKDDIWKLKDLGKKTNSILKDFFETCGLKLVDFKLEFGKHNGEIILGDEISPDTCRLWDAKTNEKLDKDRFRFDMGLVEESYREVLKRVAEAAEN